MDKKPQKRHGKDFIKKVKLIKSPVDITIGRLVEYQCSPLEFKYYNSLPSNVEMINTGSSVFIKGSWSTDRPCLINGPLSDKYIFTQIHFHWGRKITSGSEHTMDGERYAMEMHVVHFKRQYIYPDEAKKMEDGLAIIVYLLKLQSWDNLQMDPLIKCLCEVKKANSTFDMMLDPLSKYCPCFDGDFFLYRGTINMQGRTHAAIWILPRHPIGISENQVKEFHNLLDINNKPIGDNTREICPSSNENIFFINPSPAQFSTMRTFPF